MIKYLALLFATGLNATANICIKLAMRGLPEGAPHELALAALRRPILWVGLSCFGISLVSYASALKKLELSVAYPVMVGVGFVIVSVAAAVLLDERLTGLRLVGLGVIFAGVLMATR
jgi:small multidrug resistance pump